MPITNYLKNLKRESENSEIASKKSMRAIMDVLRSVDDTGGEILKLSKQSINNSINKKYKKAEIDLADAYEQIKNLDETLKNAKEIIARGIVKSEVRLAYLQNIKMDILENDFMKAREEFLEAKILFHYLSSRKKEIIMPEEELLSNFEIYAGGLADFTGELLRKARLDIIEKKNAGDDVKKYYKDTKYVYEVLSGFAFSNKSGLRTKMEQVKSYILKFEELLYNLK
ncbi:MAG: hypothetical protein V1655_04055 [bacterium]